MSIHENFRQNNLEEIYRMQNNSEFKEVTFKWLELATRFNYPYHFEWMGRPIIQYPTDIVSIQNIILDVKPDLIIETGVAWGGSLILSASMIALLDTIDAIEKGMSFDPRLSSRKVLGIDIEIRSHNRKAISSHPLASRIELLEGSSVSSVVINRVENIAKSHKTILVILDSSHTYDHVLEELHLYSKFVSLGSYCLVLDTLIDDLPENTFKNKPYSKGNAPKMAVSKFLSVNKEFAVDQFFENLVGMTCAPGGFLKKII